MKFNDPSLSSGVGIQSANKRGFKLNSKRNGSTCIVIEGNLGNCSQVFAFKEHRREYVYW